MGLHISISTFIIVSICRISQAEILDLSAYEYSNVFPDDFLTLGSCPSRLVRYESGQVVRETCPFPAKNHGQDSHAKEYSRQMSLVVTNASQLLDVIGLCEGRAASYIGILNRGGECVAINVANLVTFSNKHVIHVYKDFFQTNVETLTERKEERRHEDFSHYMEDSFYLNRILHGRLGIILIQTQFSSSKQAEELAMIPMDAISPLKILDIINQLVEIPKKLMVIMLSTSSTSLLKTHKYKGSQGLIEARRWIKESEAAYQHKYLRTKPISYGFASFSETSIAPVDLEEITVWKSVCLLEIEAYKLYKAGQHLLKPCKSVEKRKTLPTGLRRPSCTNIALMMKDAKHERSLLHDKRSRWYWLTQEEKIQLANVSSKKISSIQTQIAKESLRLMKIGKGLDLESEF